MNILILKKKKIIFVNHTISKTHLRSKSPSRLHFSQSLIHSCKIKIKMLNIDIFDTVNAHTEKKKVFV